MESGKGEVAVDRDKPLSTAELAEHFKLSVRQIYRLVAQKMPKSIAAAEAWRAVPRTLPSHMQAGHVKRVRPKGEIPMQRMAEALGVSEPRICQLWNEGMSRTSVEDAQE